MWVRALAALAWNQDAHLTAEAFAASYARPGMSVLDVGGRDVNGGARPIYEALGCNFTSMDMEADPSVDVVQVPGEPFPFPDGHFDLVVTSSCFEHDPLFWLTVREMARVTKLGGFVYNNAPSHGHYHAYPGDNYRFYYDAPAALAFWSGKLVDGARYPLEVVQQYFLGDAEWNMNVMVWQRTEMPATAFTMDAAHRWQRSARWKVQIPVHSTQVATPRTLPLFLHLRDERHWRATANMFCMKNGLVLPEWHALTVLQCIDKVVAHARAAISQEDRVATRGATQATGTWRCMNERCREVEAARAARLSVS